VWRSFDPTDTGHDAAQVITSLACLLVGVSLGIYFAPYSSVTCATTDSASRLTRQSESDTSRVVDLTQLSEQPTNVLSVSSRSSDALKLKDTPRREDHTIPTPMSASPTAATAHQYRVAPDPVTPSPVSASPVAQRPVTGVNYNQTDEATAVFDDIAKNNKWGHKESISGDGSSLDNTVGLRACIANWFINFDIADFVDVPCGDGNWQGLIPGISRDLNVSWHKTLRWVKYRGFDISPTAVERARKKNEKNSNMTFEVLDLSARVPPKADAVMVRDAIQHVPLAMGKAMLLNVKASGSRYLIVSSYDNSHGNADVALGSYYTNNVYEPPFSMPRALASCPNYDKITCTKPRHVCLSSMKLIDLHEWQPTS
jgi:SAM-dependent methyltransferase